MLVLRWLINHIHNVIVSTYKYNYIIYLIKYFDFLTKLQFTYHFNEQNNFLYWNLNAVHYLIHSWFVRTLCTFKTERTLRTRKSKTHF